MQNEITATEYEGKTYYKTISRGTEYMLYRFSEDEWTVITHRLALGRSNPGGCKYFGTLGDVAQNVKAFANIEYFINN